jgi:predicted nucleotidyltransferase
MVEPACDRYLDEVRRIVLDRVGGRGVVVYLFGSRARGTAGQASDIDLALDGGEPLPPGLLSDLREALEESWVPFTVDLVDLATAGPDLRARVDEEGVRWSD